MAVAPGSFTAFLKSQGSTPAPTRSVKPGSFSAFLAEEKPAARAVQPGSFTAFLENEKPLTTPEEGVRRGEVSLLPQTPPRLTGQPKQQKLTPASPAFFKPAAPAGTRQQMLANQAEQLAREQQHRGSMLGIPMNMGDVEEAQNLPEAISAMSFLPFRAGGQALAELGQAGSRLVAPALHNQVGDFLARLFSAQPLTEGMKQAEQAQQKAHPAYDWMQAEQDALDQQHLSPQVLAWLKTPAGQAHLARQRAQEQADRQRLEHNAVTPTLQGEDILGPRGKPRERALADQAAAARVASSPDQNWAQMLAGLGRYLPGGYAFDPNTEDIYTQAVRRNPEAQTGAFVLDMLGSANPLALFPGGALARLPGPARALANLLGAGAGVGSELPVVAARKAAELGLDALRPVGRAAEQLGQREGNLGRVGRLFGQQLGLDQLTPDLNLDSAINAGAREGAALPQRELERNIHETNQATAASQRAKEAAQRAEEAARAGRLDQARAALEESRLANERAQRGLQLVEDRAQVAERAGELRQGAGAAPDLVGQRASAPLRTAEEIRQARRAGQDPSPFQFPDDPDVAAAAQLQRTAREQLEQRAARTQDIATQERLDALQRARPAAEPEALTPPPVEQPGPVPPARTASGLEVPPEVATARRQAELELAAAREELAAYLARPGRVRSRTRQLLEQHVATAEEQLASLPELKRAPEPPPVRTGGNEPPAPASPRLEVVRQQPRGNVRPGAFTEFMREAENAPLLPERAPGASGEAGAEVARLGPGGDPEAAAPAPARMGAAPEAERAAADVPLAGLSKPAYDQVDLPGLREGEAPAAIADPEGGAKFSTAAGSSASTPPAPATPAPARAPAATPPRRTPLPGVPGWADAPPVTKVKSERVISAELGETLGRLARGELTKSILDPVKRFFSPAIGPRTVTKLSPDAKKARALGVYRPGADLVELRREGDMPTLWHETGHRVEDYTGFISNQSTNPEVMHELGKLGDPSTPIPKDGGQSSWKPGMSDAYKRGEGFAEFLRLWFHHPEEARSWAPHLSEAWDAQLDALKDVGRQMRSHQLDFQVRLKEEPQARLRSLIRDEQVGRPLTADDVITALYDENRMVSVMSEALAAAKGVDILPPSEDPALLARMLKGVDNKSAQWLDQAPLDFATQRPIEGSKSLKEILSGLERPEDYLDWRDYMVARRAKEIHADGKVSGVSHADAEAVFDALHSDHFEGLAKDFYEWEDSALRYARDAGYISEAGYARIKEMVKDHVPFHRVHEVAVGELGLPGGSGVGKGLQAGNVVKRFKGSSRDIHDPIQTAIANMAALITAAEKNRVGLAVAKHWDDARKGLENNIGWFVNEVTPPTEVLEVQMQQMMRTPAIRDLMETLGGEAGLTPDDIRDLVAMLPDAKIFREGNQAAFGENVVRVKQGDKYRFFQMQPELYQAWTALDSETVPKWLRMLSAPANLLRRGATSFSPLFAVYSNPVRDISEASVVSRVSTGKLDRVPVVGQVKRLGQGLRLVLAHDLEYLAEKAGIKPPAWVQHGDELVQDFIRQGGAQGMEVGLASEHGARAAYKEVLGRLDPAKTWLPPSFRKWLGWGLKAPVAPFLLIKQVAERLEQATRYSEVERALAVLKERHPDWTPEDVRARAAYEGRDLLDFGQGGSQVKTLRRIVPFFGSMMSGNYRTYRAVEEALRGSRGFKDLVAGAGRGVFGKGLSMLTLPTIGLYMLNRNDKFYQNLPQQEKDLMWHVRIGPEPDDWLRIPKPHLLGTLFATTPERFLTWLDKGDPQAFDHLASTYAEHMLGPAGPLVTGRSLHEKVGGMVSNLLGPLGGEGVEGMSNYDPFTGRNIEQPWLADRGRKTYMPWHERSTEYTSLTARRLAGLARALPFHLAGHMGLEESPMMLDHAINGLLGIGGRTLVQGLDLPGGLHWPGTDDYLAAAGAGEKPKQRPREAWGAIYTANYFDSVDRFHNALNQMQDVMESSTFKPTREQNTLYNQMRRADSTIKDKLKALGKLDPKKPREKEKIFKLRLEIIDTASDFTPASAPPTQKMKEAPR